MASLPASLADHRVQPAPGSDVERGTVRWEPRRSIWYSANLLAWLTLGTLDFSWGAFATFVGSTALVLLLGHSLGNHRLMVHRAFACPLWLERVLIYAGVLVGISGPLALMRTHDLRDYAQRLPRCHDYFGHRRSMPVDWWWQVHCVLELERAPRITADPRAASDPWYQFLERTWMWQQLPWALLLFGIGGWGYVAWGVCARVTACVTGHWLIGHFAHRDGGMTYEVEGAAVQGRNVPFVALLTMGESWHNNHHAFPGSVRLGLHPGEWDPGWWTLLGLRKLGLVWGFRLPADLPHRPELKLIAPDTTPSLAIGH